MKNTFIKVEGLSKRYMIGHAKNGDLRESITKSVKNFLQLSRIEQDAFWALNDISFEIKKGEAVGIIGKNGAGKSTLLKILSRITEPTRGRFELNGRVSALLEVGTGFHQELTGRENIFLNGTILGMRRAEVKRKFDEIVDFSGIEKFIDTPVKHYSSGMKVRLAFAVAAHLEPEILIVDEVLAVGDAEFQKKCVGKMSEVSEGAERIVIFVSHNMSALKSLCSRGILLDQGLVNFDGDIHTTIEKYLSSGGQSGSNHLLDFLLNSNFTIDEFLIAPRDFEVLKDFDFKLVLRSFKENQISELSLLFYSEENERVAIVDLRQGNLTKVSQAGNRVCVEGKIKNFPLVEGTYHVGLYVVSHLCTGNFLDLIHIKVTGKKSDLAPYPVNVRGYVELENDFRIYP